MEGKRGRARRVGRGLVDLALAVACLYVGWLIAGAAMERADERAELSLTVAEAQKLYTAFERYQKRNDSYPSTYTESAFDPETLDPLRKRRYYRGPLVSTLVQHRVDAYDSPDDAGPNREFWLELTLNRNPALRVLLASSDDAAQRRWRIEHAQHLHPDDIPRFAELGVIASMQGVHCTSDGPWVPERLGDRRSEEGAYVWRRLLESGAVISNGTDAPVEDVSPLASYYSTVSRRMSTGDRFYPDQRLSREEALRSYTLDAAYAAFEEDQKGSLEVGKLADITVLSQDILTIDEEDIPNTEVLYTIIGGRVRYRK